MMKKVMIFGTFDGVHKGHRALFAQACRHGDYVIAVLGRDVTVQRLKGRLPQHSEDARKEHLIREGAVDEVILGVVAGDRYQVIRDERPDVIVLGYDQEHFIEGLYQMLKEDSLSVEVVRASSHQPDIYKSSILREG